MVIAGFSLQRSMPSRRLQTPRYEVGSVSSETQSTTHAKRHSVRNLRIRPSLWTLMQQNFGDCGFQVHMAKTIDVVGKTNTSLRPVSPLIPRLWFSAPQRRVVVVSPSTTTQAVDFVRVSRRPPASPSGFAASLWTRKPHRARFSALSSSNAAGISLRPPFRGVGIRLALTA